MKNLNEKLKNITSKQSSTWRKNANFRITNKWLVYSSEIARRVLAIIEDTPDLTQAKLAELVNVSPQQISKIVQGQENLTLETIHKLSQALNKELITFPEYKYSAIEVSTMPVVDIATFKPEEVKEYFFYLSLCHLAAAAFLMSGALLVSLSSLIAI